MNAIQTPEKSRFTRTIVFGVCLLVLSGCSSVPSQPILYPNNKYESVGETTAQSDIDQCMQMATSHGVQTTADGKVLEKSATGAAVASASAGAWGIVRGDAGERALAGAAAGAAGGAVKGVIDSNQTSPVFKNFTQQCLRSKGYQVVGWQ
jgi:outer membrane lipoprotein SlyB